jgi:XXXCH domain-containing protein
MDVAFKAIRARVKAGQPPAADEVVRFVEDAARMVTYPGCGEEHYEEFLGACEALQASVDEGGPAEIERAVTRVREIEKRCHKEHK